MRIQASIRTISIIKEYGSVNDTPSFTAWIVPIIANNATPSLDSN
jgi:hypothetical protein